MEFRPGEPEGTKIVLPGYCRVERHREVTLEHIIFPQFRWFCAKYEMSPYSMARVAIRLNKIRMCYDLPRMLPEFPPDVVVANWMAKIEASIARIGAAIARLEVTYWYGIPIEDAKFVEAHHEMSEVAKAWLLSATEEEIERSGFKKHLTHHEGYMGTAIRDWFAQSVKMRDFAREARSNLLQRERDPRGSMPSRETILYGYDLPELYVLHTGRPFGVSKNSDQKVRYATGVAFVVDAAKSIGFVVKPATVAAHFNKIKREFGLNVRRKK